MKNFDPQKFLGEGVKVGISIQYDSDHKLWPTYTPRTFWAIFWINYDFGKLLSKIVQKLGHIWGAICWKLTQFLKYVNMLKNQ